MKRLVVARGGPAAPHFHHMPAPGPATVRFAAAPAPRLHVAPHVHHIAPPRSTIFSAATPRTAAVIGPRRSFFARPGFPRRYTHYVGPLPLGAGIMILAIPLIIIGLVLAASIAGIVLFALAAAALVAGIVLLAKKSAANTQNVQDTANAADTNAAPEQGANFGPTVQPTAAPTQEPAADNRDAASARPSPR